MARKKSLANEFRFSLEQLWRRWLEESPDPEMSPFTDLEEAPELDNDPGFNHLLGWLRGVSEATGWSLDVPGVFQK